MYDMAFIQKRRGGGASQSFVMGSPVPTAALPIPTLMQHVASSTNPLGVGISGNNYKIRPPNAVGAGNCLILGITYPHGSTPTITDDNGNTWPGAAAVSVDAGVGGYVAAIFVLPNAAAGLTVINVAFGGNVIPFQFTFSEYNNIAIVSPVNGSHGTADVSGTTSRAAGSFTPTNNDASGGNLIWNYVAPSGGISSNPSSWAAGASFTLLDADIAWNTNQGFPHASQVLLQTTAGAVNPTITSNGDSTDGFNCVAIALKVANAGTAKPNGIHINKIIHQTSNIPPTSSWTVQFPTTGNLRVFTANEASGVINITGVTDSDGGTWTKINPSTDEPQIWYRDNCSSNQNLTITLSISGTPATTSLRCYDIDGAAISALGATAGKTSTAVGGTSSIANAPSITPQASNSLIIARGSLGQGPGLSVTSPVGAVFTLTTYSGEIDTDLMENADLEAVYYNPSTSALHFDWTFTNNPSNTNSDVAAEFKGA